MFRVDIDVQGKEKLENLIDYIKKLTSMKTDKSFQKFVQEKVLETVNKIADERIPLYIGEDTNIDYLEEYKLRNVIEENETGFVLKNSFTIPASMLAIGENKIGNYPNGFNIALAFEYGVGIVGENTAVEGAWNYNINNYNWAWKYSEYGNVYTTLGYTGAEVYRYTAEEIKKELPNWVKEYFESEAKL